MTKWSILKHVPCVSWVVENTVLEGSESGKSCVESGKLANSVINVLDGIIVKTFWSLRSVYFD